MRTIPTTSMRAGRFMTAICASLALQVLAVDDLIAANKTFSYTAQVTADSTLGGSLPGAISVGDVITGHLTFDDAVADSFPLPGWGTYTHNTTPNGLFAKVQGTIFRTNPASVSFQVDVVDDVIGDDVYLASSFNNLATNGAANPTTFTFSLVDSTATAISSEAQPISPYDLTTFDPYSAATGTRLRIVASGDYEIIAEILTFSLNLVVDDDGFATFDDCDDASAVAFMTIQDAVDAASPGDIIKVCPGLYPENVNVYKSVSILGPHADNCPGASLDRGDEAVVVPDLASSALDGIVFYVTADDVTIKGLTIDGDNGASGGDEQPVGSDFAHAGNLIANGSFDNTFDYPFVDVERLVIENNIIRTVNDIAINIYNSGAGGMISTDNSISCNRFDNITGLNTLSFGGPYDRIAVLLYNTTYAQVDNNVMTSVAIGVQTGNNWQANDGAPASISNNDIESEVVAIFHNLHWSSASTWTLANNEITSATGFTDNVGIAIWSHYAAVGAIVQNNNVSDCLIGIEAWNNPTSNTITIQGGLLDGNDVGIELFNDQFFYGSGDATTLIVDDVTVSNSIEAGLRCNDNGGTNSVTMLVQNGTHVSGGDNGAEALNGLAFLEITGSRIDANTGHGIDVNGGTLTLAQNNCISGNTGNGVNVSNSGVVGSIFDNDLSGNALGVNNTTGVDVDASGNWWGGSTPALVSAEVSANVDYTPWLAVGTDTSSDCSDGFQGDFSTLHVDDDSPQTGSTGRIQEGIDMVTASTVIVEPGTYLESDISVHKSVAIDGNGATAGDVVVAPDLADSHACVTFGAGVRQGFIIRHSDVLIRDLTIDGDAGVGGPGSLNYSQGIVVDFTHIDHPFNNIDATNVHIRNIWRRGFYWFGGTGHSITSFVAENCGVNCSSGASVIILDGDGDEATLDLLLQNGVVDLGTTGIATNWINAPQGDFNPRVEISGVQVSDCLIGMNLSGLSGDSFINGNTIIGAAAGGEWGAIIQYALDPTTAHLGTVTFSNNFISACEQGIWLFHNEEADTPVLITGNTISAPSVLAASNGIFSTDDGDLFGDEDGDSYATISGNSIFGFETGIHLYRNGTSPAGGRYVASLIGGSVSADGNSVQSCTTAVRIFENDAELNGGYKALATIRNNLSSFVLSDVGIEVDGGAALIENNNLSGNNLAGILVKNDGLVDAGDDTSSNYTGLGSSMGCNFLAGYNGITSFAINDENLDASLNKDVLADSNFWGTVDPLEIEDIVLHTVDDPARTLVLFNNPKSVPQLVLTGPAVCSNNPSQVTVILSMRNLPVNITGYAAFLEYDTAILSYNVADSSYLYNGATEFPLHISPGSPKPEEVASGEINANASIAPFQPGTMADTDLAVLVFDVIGCGEATVFFRDASPFLSEVSTQGIPLPTELIDDSFVIDNGDAPFVSTISAPDVNAGPSCNATVSFSATVEDTCCLNEADVLASVMLTGGSATLGTLSYTATQIDFYSVSVSGSVSLTNMTTCTAEVTFSVDATDCCGNVMTTVTAAATVEDLTEPTFVSTPADVIIECDDSIVPGILFGIGTGGVAVYYNDNGNGENPANQSYLKSQFSYSNTNGAEFSFDNTPLTGNGLINWRFLFGQVPLTQFGLDFLLIAPTYDGTNVPTPLLAYDNSPSNSIAGRILVGPVIWAINDYKGGSPNGPANPATDIINSLFRSDSPGNPFTDIDITKMDVTQAGPIFTADIAGKLVSDGIIHWFLTSTPDSPASNFNLNGDFYFSGILTYDSTGDAGTDLIDFYGGTITIVANSPNLSLGFPTAVDNCTLFPVIDYTDDDSGLTGCNDTGIILRTWTATDDCGNVATHVQTITVVDTTPPVITQPADIDVIADAGGCTAYVTVPLLVATDSCGSVTITNDFNNTSDASDVYPSGSTLVTWTVEDACGNTSYASQTITVDTVNEVSATVILADVNCGIGGTPVSFVRNIRFTPKSGVTCGPALCVPVTFTGVPATGTAVFNIDCGSYDALCAKDPQHTVFGSDTLSIVGPQYQTTSGIVLLSGDTDNDGDVDINDVTYFLFQFGTAGVIGPGPCPYTGVRDADFSINGMVGIEDYTFLTSNWLTLTSCPCAVIIKTPDGFAAAPVVHPTGHVGRPLQGADAGDAPSIFRTRMRVDEFEPAVAAFADVNGDGVVDADDIRMLEDRFGLPGLLADQLSAAEAAAQAVPVGGLRTGGR